MATWAIGDVQGCFDELLALLERIDYAPKRDRLWFCGDLVNRGPKSLETLRFVKSLGEHAVTVLGNHDLHLLAVWHHTEKKKKSDTLDAILAAPDAGHLLAWLQRRPLAHYDETLGYFLCHAGLPPSWDLDLALCCAGEVERVLRGDASAFFAQMYGNEPALWDERLHGQERLRYITNAYTRMRFIDGEGRLDLKCKSAPGEQPAHLMPWFEHPKRHAKHLDIVFGHWAALLGQAGTPRVHALDTGCIWGHALTALCLESGERVSQPALQAYKFSD